MDSLMACYFMDFSAVKTASFIYDCSFFSPIVLVMLVVFYCQIFCVTVSRCAALLDVNRPGNYSGCTVHLIACRSLTM
jgi:hypothetical protein